MQPCAGRPLVGYKQSNFTKKAIARAGNSRNTPLITSPQLETKADRPSQKMADDDKKPKKEKSYKNPYDEFLDTWKQGDVLPLVPPGKVFRLCQFGNPLRAESNNYELDDKYKIKKSTVKFKNDNLTLSSKSLGPKLRDEVDSLLSRAMMGRFGLKPWVDDKNKLRCPPKTPNANQFTDSRMSNCFVAPKAAAGKAGRLARRAGAAVANATQVGGRTQMGVSAARDFNNLTQQDFIDMGYSEVSSRMAIGGRITGAMNLSTLGPSGLRYDPKRAVAGADPYHLGSREKIARGVRSTMLAKVTHNRVKNGFVRLPNGDPMGDITTRAGFLNAMQQTFPNVEPSEILFYFDNAMPAGLPFELKRQAKRGIQSFWEALIVEAIENPDMAKWVTKFDVDYNMKDAFQMSLDPFAPAIDTGGRTMSGAAAKLVSGRNAADGGTHFLMRINPSLLLTSSLDSRNSNARSSGAWHSIEGDMHYTATHEFGHLAHFSSVMNNLGFDVNNLTRYSTSPTAFASSATTGGGAAWRPKKENGGWIIDWSNMQNPMNSPSIQLVMDAARNLQTRNYGARGGASSADLKRDLENFYDAFGEAVHNNITDTEEERELMRQFAGGDYAAVNSLETRAEYYVSRRLFGETQDQTRIFPQVGASRRGHPFGAGPIRQSTRGANYVDQFAQAITNTAPPSGLRNRLATVGTTAPTAGKSPADVISQLDNIDRRTFQIQPGTWNLTGAMAVGGDTGRVSLHAEQVRRAVRNNDVNKRRKRKPQQAPQQSFQPLTSARRRDGGGITGAMGVSSSAAASSRTAEILSRANDKGIDIDFYEREKMERVDRFNKNVQDGNFYLGPNPFEPTDGRDPEFVQSQKDWVDKTLRRTDSAREGSLQVPFDEHWVLENVLYENRESGVYKSFSTRLFIVKASAAIKGDSKKIEQIDKLIEDIKNMSAEELNLAVDDALKRLPRQFSQMASVQVSDPIGIAESKRYLTAHDVDEMKLANARGLSERDRFDIETVIRARSNQELMFLGMSPRDTSPEMTELRPASGFVTSQMSARRRNSKLKDKFGEDIEIQHPYSIGDRASKDTGDMARYGDATIILRPEVAERSLVFRGDSVADTGSYSTALKLSTIDESEYRGAFFDPLSILYADRTGDYDSIASPASNLPNGGNTATELYQETMILGSFAQPDIAAIVMSPHQARIRGDNYGNQSNLMQSTNDANVTSLIATARLRDEYAEKGIDIVLKSDIFKLDEVEPFNTGMTEVWVNEKIKGTWEGATFEELVPDEQTTPYEAYLRYVKLVNGTGGKYGRDANFDHPDNQNIAALKYESPEYESALKINQANLTKMIDEELKRLQSNKEKSPSSSSITGAMAADKIYYPREPSYGAFIGDAGKIFGDAKTWEEFKEAYNKKEIIFFDYETTGIDVDADGRTVGKGSPVQIGAVRMKGGKVIDRLNVFMKPDQPLGEWSIKNLKDKDGNPLTDNWLNGQVSMLKAHQMLEEFAGPNAIFGVQYAPFDKDVLDATLEKLGMQWKPSGYLDTKDIAEHTLPRWTPENPEGPSKLVKERKAKDGTIIPEYRTASNGLADITEYLGVDLGSKHHTADADSEAAGLVMSAIIDNAIEFKFSTDVLDMKSQNQRITKGAEKYEKDVQLFEQSVLDRQTGVTGAMTSPRKTSAIQKSKRQTKNINATINAFGGNFGGDTGSDYIRDLNRNLTITGPTNARSTLDAREWERSENYKRILDEIARRARDNPDPGFEISGGPDTSAPGFWISGGPDTSAPGFDMSQKPKPTNPFHIGYIPDDNEFKAYLDDLSKKSNKRESLRELEAAVLDSHDNLSKQPRTMVPAQFIKSLLSDGFKQNQQRNKDAGIDKIVAAYEADIGIHPETPEEMRPALGFVLHMDEIEQEQKEKIKFLERTFKEDPDRYFPDLVELPYSKRTRGNNWNFEDAEIILHADVSDRTAYGNGHLFSEHIEPVKLNSTDNDLIMRANVDAHFKTDNRAENILEHLYNKYRNDHSAYKREKYSNNSSLMSTPKEALIAGGFNANDIDEIRIPFDSIPKNFIEGHPDIPATITPGGKNLNKKESNDFLKTIKEGILSEEAIKRINPTLEEKKMIQDILSSPLSDFVIPENIQKKMNRFGAAELEIKQDADKYLTILAAESMREQVEKKGIKLSVTNKFGLNVFDPKTYDKNASKKTTAREALRNKIEKQMEDIIKEMREVKEKISGD